jgi:hypothetical protein
MERIVIMLGDFEKRMKVMLRLLAFGAKIVIRADYAFVDGPVNGKGKATITLNILIYYILSLLNLCQ